MEQLVHQSNDAMTCSTNSLAFHVLQSRDIAGRYDFLSKYNNSIKKIEFQVISETRNTVNQTKNATRHAEINAVDDVEKIGKIVLIKTRLLNY